LEEAKIFFGQGLAGKFLLGTLLLTLAEKLQVSIVPKYQSVSVAKIAIEVVD